MAERRRRKQREPLPEGAWEHEALEWWKRATENPERIASFKLRIDYIGGGWTQIENSPRTRREKCG